MNIPHIIKLRDAILADPPSRSNLSKDKFPTYLTFFVLLNFNFPTARGEDDSRPLLAHILDLDADAAEALINPVNVRNITTRRIADVLSHLIETGEVNWGLPGGRGSASSRLKAAIPAAPLATPNRSLSLLPGAYSGRPTQFLCLLVILGHMAAAAYEDGERDEELLKTLGSLKRHTFSSIEEMNAYIQGVEDATGYLDHLIIQT